MTEEVEEGEEGSGGGGGGGIGFGRRDETTVEISSENSGPLRSRSEDDFEGGEADHPDDDDDIDDNHHQTNRKKKRKKYHRHTAQQIREMEAYVLSSPSPPPPSPSLFFSFLQRL